jgi:hypothetical protein
MRFFETLVYPLSGLFGFGPEFWGEEALVSGIKIALGVAD